MIQPAAARLIFDQPGHITTVHVSALVPAAAGSDTYRLVTSTDPSYLRTLIQVNRPQSLVPESCISSVVPGRWNKLNNFKGMVKCEHCEIINKWIHVFTH